MYVKKKSGGMKMAKKIVSDLNVNGKVVLIRVDLNVPMKGLEITDDNRIVQALPTINYVIENNAKVVLFSHFVPAFSNGFGTSLQRPSALFILRKLSAGSHFRICWSSQWI